MDAAIEVGHQAAPRARRLFWIALITALVGILTILSYEGFVQGANVDGLSGEAVAPVVPRAPSVVCRAVATDSCARQAANISGVPSAWVPAPAGFQLAEFFATDPSTGAAGSQVLFLTEQGGSSQISLESADHLQPRLASSQAVSAGPNSGTLSQLTEAGSVVEAQIIWSHAGHSYSLLWIAPNVDTKALVAVWNHVRYASPSAH